MLYKENQKIVPLLIQKYMPIKKKSSKKIKNQSLLLQEVVLKKDDSALEIQSSESEENEEDQENDESKNQDKYVQYHHYTAVVFNLSNFPNHLVDVSPNYGLKWDKVCVFY